MYRLYNEQYKLEFIEYLPEYKDERIKKNYLNLFNSISEYEEQLSKDFSDMNIAETKMTIVSLGVLSSATLATTITMLRDYNNWCISNRKTKSENSLLKIQSKDFDLSYNIQSRLIKSPEHLLKILKMSFGINKNGYNTQAELIAWLLYYGFTIDEILNLEKKDSISMICINRYKKNTLFFEQEDVILNLLNECSELDHITTETSDFKVKTEKLTDSKYVLRGKQNKKSSSNKMSLITFSNRVSSINECFSNNTGELIKITPDRIFKSGLFHRIYKIESEGASITNNLIFDMFKMDYERKTTIITEVSKKMKDYKNWKIAFDL